MKTMNFKKVLSMVLVLVMMMSMLVLVPLTTSAEAPPAIPGISGAGTETSPYQIADLEDLAALIAACKSASGGSIPEGTVVFATITANITLPSADSASYCFNTNAYGEAMPALRLDGGNHTISNLTVPLIGGARKYAYKRTDSKSDAIKELAVFSGKNPADSKRINIGNNTSVRFDIVANVDLNSDAGGAYLYLYATVNSAVQYFRHSL